MYTYPDLAAVCGKAMFADHREDVLLNPTAIFEVSFAFHLSITIEA